MTEDPPGGSARWRARPLVAGLLRVSALLVPIGASVAFVWQASTFVPPPTDSLGAYLGWWLCLSIGATLVLTAVGRVTRRLLPLAALLRLSLVFPDGAPSRFRTALESGTVKTLEQRLVEATANDPYRTPADAARHLLILVATLESHDRLTRGHSERVRAYAQVIGRQLGLQPHEVDRLNWAALLHDVGKLEIPTEILTRKGRPTDEEWTTIRRHPEFGERLVAPLREWLGEWIDAVGYHHERWDGNGYPRGVAGTDIPLAGRLVAVADTFDVITSTRSYKQESSRSAAREEIARCAGAQFDPEIVRAFLAISLGRVRYASGPLSWLADAAVLARIPFPSATGTLAAAAVVVASPAASGLGYATAKPVSEPRVAIERAAASPTRLPPSGATIGPRAALPGTASSAARDRNTEKAAEEAGPGTDPTPSAPEPAQGSATEPADQERGMSKPRATDTPEPSPTVTPDPPPTPVVPEVPTLSPLPTLPSTPALPELPASPLPQVIPAVPEVLPVVPPVQPPPTIPDLPPTPSHPALAG